MKILRDYINVAENCADLNRTSYGKSEGVFVGKSANDIFLKKIAEKYKHFLK